MMTEQEVARISNDDIERWLGGCIFREIELYESQIRSAGYGIGSIQMTREQVAEQIRRGRAPYEAALFLRINYLEKEILKFIESSAEYGKPTKIQAIKLLRMIHGWGLKESKDAFEKMEANGAAERARIADINRRMTTDTPSFEEATTAAIRNLHNRLCALEDWRENL